MIVGADELCILASQVLCRLEGFPALACLMQIHDDVLADDTISDLHKAVFCEAMAQTDKELADGADDLLQLYSTCAHFFRL